MIAVVDDDVCFAEETQELLCESGFQSVVVVTHPHESSLALLEQVQLLVLDLDIGGTSGLSVLQTLARRGHHPAVLMVSGSGRAALDSARTAACNGGFHVLGALQKPVSPTEFVEAVRLIEPRETIYSAPEAGIQAHGPEAVLGSAPVGRSRDTNLPSRP